MAEFSVFSSGTLKELVESLQSLLEKEGDIYAPDVVPDVVYQEDLLEDEDLPLIVQIRVEDAVTSDGVSFPEWADTDIEAEDLEEYRESYPGQEYRLVAVYDEIVSDELESVENQYVSPEDEIGLLKAEILQLKAQLENAISWDVV